MAHVDVYAPVVGALAHFSEHLQRVARIHRPTLPLVGRRPRRQHTAQRAQRVFRRNDRESLCSDGTKRIQPERLLVELGAPPEEHPSLLDALCAHVATLARLVIMQPSGRAERVQVVLVVVAQRAEHEFPRWPRRVGLDEKVGIVGAQVEIAAL